MKNYSLKRGIGLSKVRWQVASAPSAHPPVQSVHPHSLPLYHPCFCRLLIIYPSTLPPISPPTYPSTIHPPFTLHPPIHSRLVQSVMPGTALEAQLRFQQRSLFPELGDVMFEGGDSFSRSNLSWGHFGTVETRVLRDSLADQRDL